MKLQIIDECLIGDDLDREVVLLRTDYIENNLGREIVREELMDCIELWSLGYNSRECVDMLRREMRALDYVRRQ